MYGWLPISYQGGASRSGTFRVGEVFHHQEVSSTDLCRQYGEGSGEFWQVFQGASDCSVIVVHELLFGMFWRCLWYQILQQHTFVVQVDWQGVNNRVIKLQR
jgi:hypothetical protein